jgi:hypothetical protein
MPLAVRELVLEIWMIASGFRPVWRLGNNTEAMTTCP